MVHISRLKHLLQGAEVLLRLIRAEVLLRLILGSEIVKIHLFPILEVFSYFVFFILDVYTVRCARKDPVGTPHP